MPNDELHGEPVMDATERWLDEVKADPMQNKAADWLLRLQSPSASHREKTAFLAWMDQDARHVAAFAEIFWTSYRTWKMSSGYLEDVKELLEHRYPKAAQIAKRSDASSRRRVYAIAASVALIAFLSAALVHLVLITPNIAVSRAANSLMFETQIGENRTVVLEDASRLTLGGRTRVEVTLSSTKRAVTLYEGEAYFEVAKDQTRNFSVQAGPVNVTAVGTAFNINRSSGSSIVTVIEGSVVVTPLSQPGGVEALRVRLNAGEQTTATSSGVGSPIVVRDLPAVISWPTGRLSFRNRPLREAVSDVNRYAHKPLVLAPEVDDVAVTGTLMIDNVGSWVKSLERAFNLTAIEESDRIIIRPGGMH